MKKELIIVVFILNCYYGFSQIHNNEINNVIFYFKMKGLPFYARHEDYNSNAVRAKEFTMKVEIAHGMVDDMDSIFLSEKTDSLACKDCEDYLEIFEPVIVIDFIGKNKIISSVSISRNGNYIRDDALCEHVYIAKPQMIKWLRANFSEKFLHAAFTGFVIIDSRTPD